MCHFERGSPANAKMDSGVPIVIEDDEDEIQYVTSYATCRDRIQRMTRAELEVLCTKKICESIEHKSEIEELTRKVELRQREMATFGKEVADMKRQRDYLRRMHAKLSEQMYSPTGYPVEAILPVKITRSVSIQTNIVNETRMAAALKPKTTNANANDKKGQDIEEGEQSSDVIVLDI